MERRFDKVGVLKGGISSEREISLRSGDAVAEGLREAGYDVFEIDVTSPEIFMPGSIEAVFIALHGEFGEDGTVQNMLRESCMPYTGSDPDSSSLSFDKGRTRACLQQCGVPVAKGEVLKAAIGRTIPFPLVVKPPREGSSIGCHVVRDEADWLEAFLAACRFSGTAVVEEYIPGRELTVGILGDQILPIVEICAADQWYDFDAKYKAEETRYVVPADLEPGVVQQCRDIASQTFTALGARGFGRVDIRLSPDNQPYVLELNSIPGFTKTSLLPKAAAAVGISFPELCCRIMESAAV